MGDNMLHLELIALSRTVTAFALNRSRLGLHSVNGHAHWKNVLKYGLDIQAIGRTEIDRKVLLLFSLLHDVEKLEESGDPEHGQRAAQLVSDLQGDLFDLEPGQLDQLMEACAGHGIGGLHTDPTIQVCWDADRLDMSRFGVPINLERLQTEAAQRIAESRNDGAVEQAG